VDLLDSIRSKRNAIILPRPWPNDKEKEFMESDIALFLKNSGIDTCKLKTWVFEFLTKKYEKVFRGNVSNLEGRQFDALSVMVIDQVKRKTYLEFN
jgi:precorrin-6B methylase 1